MASWGTVIPEDLPLGQLPAWLDAVQRLGWSEVWSGEVAGRDAFAALAACAALAPDLRLGAIIAATTRGPGLLAMSVATLADLAPGRLTVALGSSSPQVLEGWNDRPSDRPYTRLSATVRFLKRALSGERVVDDFGAFTIDAFRLAVRPRVAPELLLAGLGPRIRAFATDQADGVLLNWIAPGDVTTFGGAQPNGGRVGAVAYYAPGEQERELARRLVVTYVNVPAYAAHHRRLGRGNALEPVWAAWSAGNRRAALAALPDAVLDELVVSGSPASCRARLAEYFNCGLDRIVLHVLASGDANLQALDRLGKVT